MRRRFENHDKTSDADASSSLSGYGVLRIEVVRGKSTVVRSRASNPLKILAPRRPHPAAWIYTSTFGGGLVAGDDVRLDVLIGQKAACCLTTQSATKVYRSPQGCPARQELHATVAHGGVLVVAPDPVICFTDAVYEQQQRVDVHAGGALVVVDWLTSGRRGCGECWAFQRYLSKLEVNYDGTRVLTDVLRLDRSDGPIDSPHRMGQFHCLAALVTIGDRFAETNKHLIDEIASSPVKRDEEIIESASSIPHGAVTRIIGATPQRVAQRLSQRLEFTREALGTSPWERKW